VKNKDNNNSHGGLVQSPPPPGAWKSIFINNAFYNSLNSIRDIKPFCRPLLCHSSIVK